MSWSNELVVMLFVCLVCFGVGFLRYKLDRLSNRAHSEAKAEREQFQQEQEQERAKNESPLDVCRGVSSMMVDLPPVTTFDGNDFREDVWNFEEITVTSTVMAVYPDLLFVEVVQCEKIVLQYGIKSIRARSWDLLLHTEYVVTDDAICDITQAEFHKLTTLLQLINGY